MSDEMCLSESKEDNYNITDKDKVISNLQKQVEVMNMKLKEKEFEVSEHIRRWQFYELIVKSLTTFK